MRPAEVYGRHDWLKKWAMYSPEKLYLREYSTGSEFTFEQTNDRVDTLAALLQNEYHLQPGERIAIFSKNSLFYVELYLAAIRTGTILVPLNFRLTAPELEGLIRDAAPRLVLYQEELKDTLPGYVHTNTSVTAVSVEQIKDSMQQSAAMLPGKVSVNDDTVTMILYTAGTTGIPKGVMITHRMLLWNAINTVVRLDITSADHTQSYAPFFHTGGWNVLFTPFLFHGASHTILEKFDVEIVLRLMEQEKSTILFGVPTMLQMMSEHPLFPSVNLSSIRYAIVGGAPMPLSLIETWHNKGIPIRQGYGLTEVGPNCFSLPEKDAIRKRGSIGFPNLTIDPRLIDEDGKLCGVDEPGELQLKSPVVTPGYWGKPEETADSKDGLYFKTGDIATRDSEGYYYIVDRKKNMYISGGENVYPAETERIIYALPQVREVAVIGVPDARWGETGMACISLHPGAVLTGEQVLKHCTERLAKYKVPKYVRFFDDLPKTDAGKINKRGLQETQRNTLL